ncbi:ABC transporter substrate-binding protein [Bacillus sp. UMB0899]|nr:ABC transporter substrate-binding protein [Bacillus sp. UMB0899]
MRFTRVLGLIFGLLMVFALLGACSNNEVKPPSTTDTTTDKPGTEEGDTSKGSTPRNETLYVNGLQWGPPSTFSPLGGNPSFPVAYANSRSLVYENLFMINMLDGALEPLLGTSYEWTDDTTLHIELNPDAKWNDGEAFTAEDVVYSYELGNKYPISWSNFWEAIESVEADGENAVNIRLKQDNPNRLTVLDSLQLVPMMPKHVWEAIEKTHNNDIAAIREEVNPEPVGTGPYKMHTFDNQKITLIRDDNYWGQELFGGLPAPKYVSHVIYKDNAAGSLAFSKGEVDVSQQFIPQVWKMWEDGTPIKTYLKDKPYYLPGSMPSIFFNTTKEGLDNPDVRRAIAMAIDYDKISELAMSGYSGEMKPSITLDTPSESKFVDQEAIKSLQWTTDVDAANELLDSIGAKKGADGIRVLDGIRLGPWEIEAPYGWSDWNASLEIVAQNAKAIGIEIRTNFPEAPVWTNNRQTGKFDIIMDTPAGAVSPSQPWNRARTIMYSEGVAPIGEMAFWNWGRYKNERADELIKEIPTVTDEAKLKEMYTELTKIYLEDVPTIPLMYRPWVFHTVNESVWEGFATDGDGSNIPPQISIDGAGIKDLYQIKNK